MNWLLLILSLPTDNPTARMRIWRGLKASGAVTLRDGVYLLPDNPACSDTFGGVATEVAAAGGSAQVLAATPRDGADFSVLFDRSADYRELQVEATRMAATLTAAGANEARRHVRKLRRRFAQLAAIDFFPGECQRHADATLTELEHAVSSALSPDEPSAAQGDVPRLQAAAYRGRLWATRRRPWVDRLASGWLIRRFIDPEARFLWLESPADCPPDALGFDFDGAAFTHVGDRVSFETLLASFGLEADPALAHIGRIVHCLDVGGLPPPEAAGVELLLAGLRARIADDDALLDDASQTFDTLHYALNQNREKP
ncbi:MAG: chromate resistance protein [Zoogloeaceae bacterium]|nr:chromate resistance protein [Zoogloeaceae bacterium]